MIIAVDGHCTKPDGKDLAWKQIGVLGTLEDKQLPFFIEWFSLDHPSTDGKAIAKIVKVEVEWVSTSVNDGDSGIVTVHVMTPSGVVRLD